MSSGGWAPWKGMSILLPSSQIQPVSKTHHLMISNNQKWATWACLGLAWNGSHRVARDERQEVVTVTASGLEMGALIQRLSEGTVLVVPAALHKVAFSWWVPVCVWGSFEKQGAFLWGQEGQESLPGRAAGACFYPGVFPSSHSVVFSEIRSRLNPHRRPHYSVQGKSLLKSGFCGMQGVLGVSALDLSLCVCAP